VATATGLRQGEALGLRWRDVDLDVGQLRVAHSLQRVPIARRTGRGPEFVLAEPKTDRSRRAIHLPGVVIAALREHRVRQLEERFASGAAWQDLDLVFCTTVGTPMVARNLSRAFAHLLKQAGLPSIRFHDLRHSAATLMLAQGVSPRVIMETLGHSQIGMTMNLYAHVMPSMQREAADLMDAALCGSTADRHGS